MQTHETFIASVKAIVEARLNENDREALRAIKMVYGAGSTGLRGVTYYNRWNAGTDSAVPFVEVCAFGQSSVVQLAGTTIHELGHVLAGWNAGHGAGWKACCATLGLRQVKAAGTAYNWAMFDPSIRAAIALLPVPDDGAPVASLGALIPRGMGGVLKPCGAGIGTKGGKSQGKGSGSRLRLFHCDCVPPVKVRASREVLAAHCDCCSGAFHPA